MSIPPYPSAGAERAEELAATPAETDDPRGDRGDSGPGFDPSALPAGARSSEARPSHLICVASSAGGLQAMRRLFQRLPRDLDATIVVTQHLPPSHQTILDLILARTCDLPVSVAANGERLQNGHVYVAPPGYHHVIVSSGRIRFQPRRREDQRGVSGDPLFVSGAADFGAASIGVVLSGSNRNGAAGVRAIRAAGGKAVAQAPDDAAFTTMPRAAIEAGVDFCGTAEEVADYLTSICGRRCSEPPR